MILSNLLIKFKTMRQKTGGRTKGTPNKITAKIKEYTSKILAETLESLDINNLTDSEKIKLLQVLLQYSIPKLRDNDNRHIVDNQKEFTVQVIDSVELKQRLDNAEKNGIFVGNNGGAGIDFLPAELHKNE